MMLSAVDVQRKKLDDEMLAELEEWAMNTEEVREALIEWENLSSKKKNRERSQALDQVPTGIPQISITSFCIPLFRL